MAGSWYAQKIWRKKTMGFDSNNTMFSPNGLITKSEASYSISITLLFMKKALGRIRKSNWLFSGSFPGMWGAGGGTPCPWKEMI